MVVRFSVAEIGVALDEERPNRTHGFNDVHVLELEHNSPVEVYDLAVVTSVLIVNFFDRATMEEHGVLTNGGRAIEASSVLMELIKSLPHEIRAGVPLEQQIAFLWIFCTPFAVHIERYVEGVGRVECRQVVLDETIVISARHVSNDLEGIDGPVGSVDIVVQECSAIVLPNKIRFTTVLSNCGEHGAARRE